MRYMHNPWGHNVLRTISRSKEQRSRSYESFELCYVCGFLLIWPNNFIYGLHTTHEGPMCRAPFSGRKVKGQGHMDLSIFLPCPLCSSIPISPIQLIWYTHNPWGHNVSCTISRSKCQRSWSHGWFEVFAPWLPPYLTKSCHMCHTHNIWGCNVSRPIFRMKVQRSRPHGSLQMLLIDMYHRGSP